MPNEEKKTKTFPFKIVVAVSIIAVFILLLYLATLLKQEKISVTKKTDAEVSQDQGEVMEVDDVNKKIVEQMEKAAVTTVRAIDDTDHVWGELEASVQLIIYDDFECPFCAGFYDTTEEIKEYFGEKVVIAFRHFPLNFHPMAVPAALASECAAEQGKFWEMYDKLFADNKEKRMSIEQFKKDAVELGLDAAKFNQCLDTEEYKDKIFAQVLEGRNYNVTGTPGNFVNSEPVPGAYPFEDFIGQDGQKREGMKSIIERHLDNRN